MFRKVQCSLVGDLSVGGHEYQVVFAPGMTVPAAVLPGLVVVGGDLRGAARGDLMAAAMAAVRAENQKQNTA